MIFCAWWCQPFSIRFQRYLIGILHLVRKFIYSIFIWSSAHSWVKLTYFWYSVFSDSFLFDFDCQKIIHEVLLTKLLLWKWRLLLSIDVKWQVAFHAPCAFPHYSITLLMIIMKSMQTKPMPLFHEEKIYSQLNCVPPQFTQGADQLYDCQNYPFVSAGAALEMLKMSLQQWRNFTLRYILYFFLVFTCWFQIYVQVFLLWIFLDAWFLASEWRFVGLYHHCVLYWLVSVIKLASD